MFTIHHYYQWFRMLMYVHVYVRIMSQNEELYVTPWLVKCGIMTSHLYPTFKGLHNHSKNVIAAVCTIALVAQDSLTVFKCFYHLCFMLVFV